MKMRSMYLTVFVLALSVTIVFATQRESGATACERPIRILDVLFPSWRSMDGDLRLSELAINRKSPQRAFEAALYPACARQVIGEFPQVERPECRSAIVAVYVEEQDGIPTLITTAGRQTGRDELTALRLEVKKKTQWTDQDVVRELNSRHAKFPANNSLTSNEIKRLMEPIFGPIEVVSTYFQFRQSEELPPTELLWRVRFKSNKGTIYKLSVEPFHGSVIAVQKEG